MEAWIYFIHVKLLIEAVAYALFLNLDSVYEWYHLKNRMWITVAGGVILTGEALAELSWAGALEWRAALYYATLFLCSGIPIIYWQHKRAKQRKQIEEDI